MRRHKGARFLVTAVALATGVWTTVQAGGGQNLKTDSGTKDRQITVVDAAGRKHTRVKPFTPAERKAAAQRLAAKRAAALKTAQNRVKGGNDPFAAKALMVAAAGGPAVADGTYLITDNGELLPDYSGAIPNYANSPAPAYQVVTDANGLPVLNPDTGFTIPIIDPVTGLPVPTATPGGIRKFVDPLPNLYISGVSPTPTGRYIPVAVPDVLTYACATMYPAPATPPANCKDADYYEIELGEYQAQMHSDLQPTTLRGYKQTNASDPLVTAFNYLGPVIIAKKGRPVRIKFTNKLPIGAGGNLFVPSDATIMGAGTGPLNMNFASAADVLCKKDPITRLLPGICYTENRATLHLHGGVTPWISDGTPHQWITPAGEQTSYKEGVSVFNVPDMTNPGKPGSASNPAGSGSQTFYYTNDQSARLMFYHDHASGTTRLNVYIGEAAGYLITDDTEAQLVGTPEAPGVIPADQIPLILQDKTFVDASTIAQQDPTWNWGTGPVAQSYTDPFDKTRTMQIRAPKTGDLWWPHVYMPAQNPYDISGANAMGRWHYGPWFWPPTVVPHGPVPNPYYDCNALGLPDVDHPCTMPWQPLEIPGAPNPSWGAEAFLDTPVVNGAAYPTLTVEPKAYRFRILNAAHDRFWNLQLYEAVSKNGPSIETMPGTPPTCGLTADCTEVRMVPAAPGSFPADPTWPVDGRVGGVPDPSRKGPSFVYIGTEGGFLPMPVVVPNQPITWNANPTTFNFGNVENHALLLGPAERADVIIDFSQFAGKTLILYNDAPAAFPALDPRNDYFTGNPDLRDSGGVFTTLAGFGPNIRTVMQINVGGTANGTAYDVAALQAAWAPVLDGNGGVATKGVFGRSQDDIIVGQSAYDEAYGKTFPQYFPAWGVARIEDTSMTIETVDGSRVVLPLDPKAIHDEMGATFDDYGRMSAKLGLELPKSTAMVQNFVMQGYNDPATELVKLSRFGTPIGDPLDDGTQIWKITHNGVDTHPVHFHLFHVQLINRVGWDGAIRLPHPTELGWKDTLRISPLEDTIVALRPIAPSPESLPFDVPNSVRPLNPALPLGSSVGFTNLDPLGNNITVFNEIANFGWEYVWHCHILSHEENDMMRSVLFAVPPGGAAPTLSYAFSGTNNGRTVNLSWTPNTSGTTSGYVVVKAQDPNFTVKVKTWQLGMVTTFSEVIGRDQTPYFYKVAAVNTVGSTVPGFPTMTASGTYSNVVMINSTLIPSNLLGTIVSPTTIQLTFKDNAVNEAGFVIQRSLDAGVTFTDLVTLPPNGPSTIGTVTYDDTTVSAPGSYTYRVRALPSTTYAPSYEVIMAVPRDPFKVSITAAITSRTSAAVTLTWKDNSLNESGFVIQRSDAVDFSTNLAQWTVGANVTTFVNEGRIRGKTFYYRIAATNVIGPSAWVDFGQIIIP